MLTGTFLQGSAATDLRRGGSFKSSFLCKSFLDVIVKKIMKIVPLLKIKVGYFSETQVTTSAGFV